ncbi:MAG TPA: hypothetical protein VFG25_03525 [Nitrosopumilaceae archaeon]|nr:hypothetical protein [Nitrosopumilaceae archaeon]
MDSNERILAHIVSVWRESKKFVSIGGREGMLILTDRHLMFIHKTEAKMKWWQAVVQRQIVSLLKDKSKNIMVTHDGYSEKDLKLDLENEKNMEVSFDDITKIEHKEESWGSTLNIEYTKNGKKEKFQFSVVQSWVKYPAKDPQKYMRVDWKPLVQYIKDHQKLIP